MDIRCLLHGRRVRCLRAFDFTALFFDPDPSNGYGSINARAQTLKSYAAFAQRLRIS